MNSKKISIITVCHNAENTISKTIDSVNSQTFQNIEHIIIDGLSTDLTYKIAKNKKKLPGIILSEKDKSSQSAMNKALNYVTGDVVFFLHADDFLSNKNIINEVMDLFKDNIDIVYGNIEYYSHNKKKVTGRKFIPGEYTEGAYLKGWHAPHPAFFVKNNCYKKYGNFKEEINTSADFEIMFRFQELQNLKSIYLNKTITYMGVGGNSGNIKNILIGNYYVVKSLLLHKQKIFIPIYLFKRLFPKIIAKIQLILKL